MLTSDLAMSWRRGQQIGPRYVDSGDADHLWVAEELIGLVSAHHRRTRAELDSAFLEFIGSGTDYRVIRGLIKLLTDECVFETVSPVEPADIRRAVFQTARGYHPVTSRQGARESALAEAAAQLGVSVEEVEAGLYADLDENQRLVDFAHLTPVAVLDRYNLAQAQALLYRSVEMRLYVEPQESVSMRRLFDAVKAYRLVYDIRGAGESGYEIVLSGPVSLFHRSQKYGVQMAVFLPALLACAGWRMRAEIDVKPHGVAYFDLDSAQTRLNPVDEHAARERHPAVERLIASCAQADSAWSAQPSLEVLDLGESAFIPDLTMRHHDGTIVYVEALGFWTPRYLAGKLRELERGGVENYVFVASDELRASRDPFDAPPPNVVIFKATPDVKAIRRALENVIGAGGERPRGGGK